MRKHNGVVSIRYDHIQNVNIVTYVYNDSYLNYTDDVLDEGNENIIINNGDVFDGESLEYYLDGPLSPNEFSFDHVKRIDESLNGKPIEYIEELNSSDYEE